MAFFPVVVNILNWSHSVELCLDVQSFHTLCVFLTIISFRCRIELFTCVFKLMWWYSGQKIIEGSFGFLQL